MVEVVYTKAEESVLGLLRHGSKSAVKISQITDATGLGDRRVKRIVRALRIRHGHPICGEKGKNSAPGYYIADTAEELERTWSNLIDQALAMLKAASVIKNVNRQAVMEKRGQLHMAIEELTRL
jgi:hypothetical protein